jgi:hypothetical protein
MELWETIRGLCNQTLTTLKQKKKFDVLELDRNHVNIFIHASGKNRPVPKAEIEAAYNHLLLHGEISRTEIEAKYSPRNPVYVSVFLSKVPGVTYSIYPTIVLRILKQ